MSSTTAARAETERAGGPGRRPRTSVIVLAILGTWLIGAIVLNGRQTLATGGAELTGLHTWLNGINDSFGEARATGSNPFFALISLISDGLNALVEGLRLIVTQPALGRPVPVIGWLGALALAAWLALAAAGARAALWVGLSVLVFGLLGLWQDAWDLLSVTFIAVAICNVVGVPLGIWMARSARVRAVLTPVLDVMQTMPSFAYLTPVALFFGIGSAAAIVLTVVYALPPLIRVTAHGVSSVTPSTVEASRSLGVSGWQLLRQVQLPMARSTIVVGVNQCTMAALSMATIAALVNGPGLGKPVVAALQSLDVGSAFVASLAIVVTAIMLDRTTTRASLRAEIATRTGEDPRRRRIVLAVAGVVAAVAIWLSTTYLWAAVFPSTDIGSSLAATVGQVNDTVVSAVGPLTLATKNLLSTLLINPLQALLAGSPWWLMAGVILALAAVLGGWKAAVTTVICEAVILGTGLWNESMKTLTTSLVATVLVMAVAIVVGVLMGRSARTDALVRPVLDAFQTIPPFVYLVPALALFDPTRFTAIVAAFVYALPVATKLVADGIRGVSPTTIEAVQSLGSTTLQTIGKVQLPMARSTLLLAANQGLLYVLSMVVIGGLVGGGGLGYFVYAGFTQGQLWGKGLAAGVAITALGVMIDRILQYSAQRYGRG